MTKTQVDVITSVQRRRRWSREEKERIVAAALEPGAVTSEVARAAGIHTSQLFRWRQQLCSGFRLRQLSIRSRSRPNRGTIALLSLSPLPERAGMVEIEFAIGGRMRI